jgi:3-hydroxyisobutyrate dehydrogenase
MTAQKVGLIGIGSMGWPMGARIRQAGFTLTAIDAVASRGVEFAKATGAFGL